MRFRPYSTGFLVWGEKQGEGMGGMGKDDKWHITSTLYSILPSSTVVEVLLHPARIHECSWVLVQETTETSRSSACLMPAAVRRSTAPV